MPSTIDGLLVQWGDRLFYPSNRSKVVGDNCLGAVTTTILAG
jgi:hypothetical protein